MSGPAPVLFLAQCISTNGVFFDRAARAGPRLGFRTPQSPESLRDGLPLLDRTDHVFVLKRDGNVLRAPLTVDKVGEAPVAMVFRDRTYACKFQHQFDPESLLEEYQLGDLETYIMRTTCRCGSSSRPVSTSSRIRGETYRFLSRY